MNDRRTYVIAYDVRAPHRLLRTHRALTRLGYPLQYSLFAADLTPIEKTKARCALEQIVDVLVDDVRIYTVPSDPFGACCGPPLVPGALVIRAPAATLAERLQRFPFGRPQ